LKPIRMLPCRIACAQALQDAFMRTGCFHAHRMLSCAQNAFMRTGCFHAHRMLSCAQDAFILLLAFMPILLHILLLALALLDA
jgi:hypothetical protein